MVKKIFASNLFKLLLISSFILLTVYIFCLAVASNSNSSKPSQNQIATNNLKATSKDDEHYIDLSEYQRKKLYQEEVLFQDKTSKESKKLYPTSIDNSDAINLSNIKSQQQYNYQKEKKWRIAHNLTYDQDIKLGVEGYKKGWTPPYSN